MSMSLKLNELEISSATPVSIVDQSQKNKKTNSVKRLGVISLILAVAGVFIPGIGVFMLIAAWLISRSALRISSDYLVSDEDDKLARWANVISKVFLVFSVIGLVILILGS
jgi:hypothetical protein